jgi:hypothetical protein
MLIRTKKNFTGFIFKFIKKATIYHHIFFAPHCSPYGPMSDVSVPIQKFLSSQSLKSQKQKRSIEVSKSFSFSPINPSLRAA